MKLCIFTICKDEARMMVWFLRHYSTIADKIIVFDEQSSDGTRELVKACPKAELHEWPWHGLDDEKFQFAVNNWYREEVGNYDYVAWVDVDELLWSPNLLRDIEQSKADVITTTGYALINREGWPVDDGKSQAYELVKTGVRQSNYDKPIIWRPEISIQHAIGRHRYEGQWPKYSGKPIVDVGIKLFHLHHLGALEGTVQINARNLGRAVNKKYAWNYTEAYNNPEQVGSAEWVRDAIVSNKLIDCVTGFVKPSEVKEKSGLKIQVGSGSNELEGWINTDVREAAVIVDISKPLPYPDGCASHILASHVIEHVSHKEAWNFLSECHRILQPRGVVRICIPDITRMWAEITPEYCRVASKEGTSQAAIRAAVFDHGHNAAWNKELLASFLQAIGFQTIYENYGESTDSELCGIDGHGKAVGESIARTETSVVEGVKL